MFATSLLSWARQFFFQQRALLSHAAAVTPLTAHDFSDLVRNALAEDIGTGDATSLALIPEHAQASARLVAREPLVVAGVDIAASVFSETHTATRFTARAADGDRLPAGATLLQVAGATRALLAAERTALNFLQRLCGIATLTATYVEAIAGTRAVLLDTRKTTPGWRRLEKHAAACGGARNHRMGLFDLVLIKDNHLAALRDAAPNAVAAAIARARAQYPKLKVEVEADSLEQARQAAEHGADIVLLDNMPVETLRQAVRELGGITKLEASGGITLANIRAIAETGVDFISVGALTHSARAVDISMELEALP